MSFGEYYAFREEMVERLRRDLLGPSEANEVLTDRPTERYIVGILFPQLGNDSDQQSNEQTRDETTDYLWDPERDYNDPTEDYDDAVAMSNVKYPSSMGISFAVDLRVSSRLVVSVTAARYQREHDDEGNELWRRVPLTADSVEIDVSMPRSERLPTSIDGLELFLRVRPPRENRVSCTLALINTQRTGFDRDERNEKCFFQPVIRVRTSDGSPAFVDRRYEISSFDRELRSYELLYRHAKEFAVGHGCSVDWAQPRGTAVGVSEVWTEFIPTYELLLVDSNPNIPVDGLSMLELAEGDRTEVCDRLRRFCDGYDEWIQGLETEIETGLLGHLSDVARDHVDLCRDALERMRAGIDLLDRDDAVWTAFRLMNRAMLEQRARTEWHRAGRPTTGPQYSAAHRWRPFQLAFILLCLRGIVQPEHHDRTITDLLWFPTGGGKTEAYLGLIAFTIFHRRLRDPRRGGGVTALMRYTLRLLTIQQFQRATLLICACEKLRRAERSRLDLGEEPISIGLWLGQDATPNTRKQAKENLKRLREGQPVTRANPKQLDECPWCGAVLDADRNYGFDKHTDRLIVACGQHECEFQTGLPIYLVDEDIYAVRPALIIATADKFATLPWREQSRAVFNIGSGFPPPELIIQDELHLISGPLGTLTGLYESAIYNLCARNGVSPKVIASTATIRRANDQVLALFGTPEMRQFPPPGIDARDSYFAVEARKERKGTRRYVGVMAPSTSHATLLVRTYASLLHSGENVPGPTAVRDHYWTLVGYFGSLRVLGAASLQVRDDVALRLKLLANSLNERPRDAEVILELTSNVPGSEIPHHLHSIQVPYVDPDQPEPAVDVVLATNMISVGVDVDRLGLMAVMGQPQSASEYIQATSRVGRQCPGLVVTMYNAGRSRDRSHYESFRSFHQAMYRQVESTSVTPFSARARDRALHAVLVTLVRLTIPEMASNQGAAKVAEHEVAIRALIDQIVARVNVVAPEEANATRAQLEQILETWLEMARRTPDLVYEDGERVSRSLLVNAANDAVGDSPALPTMWSFRDVDKESTLYFVPERVY